MEAENRRWTTEDIERVTTFFRDGMASALWEDALQSMREEARQEGGDVDIAPAQDQTPDAAYSASDALISLLAAANGIGDPSTPDEQTLDVMNDAAEEGNWKRVDELLVRLNSVPFVFAMRASSATGLPYYMIFAKGQAGEQDIITLGHYMYMEGVGHGVAWSDNHPKFKHERGTLFECHLFQGTGTSYLTWGGRSGSYETGLQVSGEENTEWDFDADEDIDEVEGPVRRIAVSFEITHPETGEEVERGWAQDPGNGYQDGEILPEPDEGETWADVAAKFIRDNSTGVEPSNVPYQPNNRTWYTEVDGERIDDEQHQRLTFFLRNFTEAEQRAVYDLLTS